MELEIRHVKPNDLTLSNILFPISDKSAMQMSNGTRLACRLGIEDDCPRRQGGGPAHCFVCVIDQPSENAYNNTVAGGGDNSWLNHLQTTAHRTSLAHRVTVQYTSKDPGAPRTP